MVTNCVTDPLRSVNIYERLVTTVGDYSILIISLISLFYVSSRKALSAAGPTNFKFGDDYRYSV